MIWLLNIALLVGILQNIFFPIDSGETMVAFWNLLPMLAGSAIGAAQSDTEQREAKAVRERNALDTQYSPWVKGSYENVPAARSMLAGAFTGGLQGYNMGQGMEGAFGGAETPIADKFSSNVKAASPMMGGGQASPWSLGANVGQAAAPMQNQFSLGAQNPMGQFDYMNKYQNTAKPTQRSMGSWGA